MEIIQGIITNIKRQKNQQIFLLNNNIIVQVDDHNNTIETIHLCLNKNINDHIILNGHYINTITFLAKNI